MFDLKMYTFISIVVTFSSILILTPVAKKLGLVAHSGEHRQHVGAVPLIGGICIYIGIIITLLFTGNTISNGLFLACTAVVLFGLVDDKWTLPFVFRFFVQILAALSLVYFSDLKLNDLGHLISSEKLELNFWSVPLTVFSIV